ncbi:hypothetical protein BC835DRAFT_1002712 [Cytidiella melzeri]|nr:hypothetical protein BC835DRAFT_1002712 [Cytidiella melzeri]
MTEMERNSPVLLFLPRPYRHLTLHGKHCPRTLPSHSAVVLHRTQTVIVALTPEANLVLDRRSVRACQCLAVTLPVSSRLRRYQQVQLCSLRPVTMSPLRRRRLPQPLARRQVLLPRVAHKVQPAYLCLPLRVRLMRAARACQRTCRPLLHSAPHLHRRL